MATANMKDVKRRIKSVESTMQITKAMQLVASSKMRKAKQHAEAAQPFFKVMYETMCDISQDKAFRSAFTGKSEHKSTLLVVIAGDRGLAGGFNANVLKMAQNRADSLTESGSAVKIMAVGKKTVEFFEKRDYELAEKYAGIAESIDAYTVQDIGNGIVQSYKSGEYDKVELVYTTLVSALTQEPVDLQILPVEHLNSTKDEAVKPLTIYDPTPEAVFDGMIPQYISGLLYAAIVDSYAAEQAARRTAMESASDNAGEMINQLSLLYNRARQAVITQELTEISSASLRDE